MLRAVLSAIFGIIFCASLAWGQAVDLDHYMSVQDLADKLGAELSFSRAEQAYRLTWADLRYRSVVLPVNSQEFWMNQDRHFFSVPTLLDGGVLYVPFEPILSSLQPSKEEMLSRLSVIHPRLDRLSLPHFDEELPLFLKNQDQKTWDIQNAYFYQNETLFVGMDAFLKDQGFQMTQTAQSIALAKRGVQWVFWKDKPVITVIKGSKTETLFSESVPIQKGSQLYFPFSSLLNAVGLMPLWDEASSTIKVYPSLTNVSFSGAELRFQIPQMKEGCPVVSEVVGKTWRFTLSHVKVDRDPFFSEGLGVLRSATLLEDGDNTVVSFTQTKELHPVWDVQEGQFVIRFLPMVKLTEESTATLAKVVLSASSPLWVTPSVKIDGSQIKITFPQSFAEGRIDPTSRFFKNRRLEVTQNQTQVTLVATKASDFSVTQINPNLMVITAKKRKTVLSEPVGVPTSLSQKWIAIDADHGGGDPGGIGSEGIYEKNYTWDISKQLRDKLIQNGFRVLMVRQGDGNPSLSDRVVMANQAPVDLFVSVHINSFVRPEANGTETYYFKPEDKLVAQTVHSELLDALDLKDNGIKPGRLYVLRHTTMPAVLVEPAFITNPTEGDLLAQPEFRTRIAQALFRGIVAYFKAAL